MPDSTEVGGNYIPLVTDERAKAFLADLTEVTRKHGVMLILTDNVETGMQYIGLDDLGGLRPGRPDAPPFSYKMGDNGGVVWR